MGPNRPPVTPEEREVELRQIVDMLGTLHRAALHLRFNMLAYLITMAKGEAERILRDVTKP